MQSKPTPKPTPEPTPWQQDCRKLKRPLVGDLQKFKEKNGPYLEFIKCLRDELSESGEFYGAMNVTKRKAGNTKIILQDGSRQVTFIYNDQDVYIIGFIVGDRFYLGNGYKLSKPEIIAGASIKRFSYDFSYGNLLPKREKSEINVRNLNISLEGLTEIGEPSQSLTILQNHLSPFVVAFAEALRFDVIARAVQNAIAKGPDRPDIDGKVKLCTNVVKPLSLGHPSHREEDGCAKEYPGMRIKDPIFSMYAAMDNWGKLSNMVENMYIEKKDPPRLLENSNFFIFEKNQLNTLLTLANSQQIDRSKKPKPTNSPQTTKPKKPNRNKRHLSHIPYEPLKAQSALVENKTALIANDDNFSSPKGSSTTLAGSITHISDVLGALQLLTLGVLYLCGRKLNISAVGGGGGSSNSGYQNSHQAQAIAVELVDRIKCFLDSSSSSAGSWLDYDEAMELQRRLASGLVQGDPVDRMMMEFIGRKYADRKGENDEGVIDLDEANRFIASALAESSGFSSTKDGADEANWCNLL